MTFLRWAGSKKQLLDTLSCCWHASNVARPARYVEAFSGSAALFFRVRPSSAVLVDVNAELQHCLRRVRSDPEAVSRELETYKGSEDEYYQVRAQSTKDLSADHRAARFIYLNRFCFNGLYRTNLKGLFNVPFGGARNGSLPTREQLTSASVLLRRAQLFTGDFYEVLHGRIKAGDFVYMDPPYARRNATLDNQYGPDVFGAEDLLKLADLAEQIDRAGGHFLVSYADCPEIQGFSDQWTSYRVSVSRTIAANIKHRRPATELLITNM